MADSLPGGHHHTRSISEQETNNIRRHRSLETPSTIASNRLMTANATTTTTTTTGSSEKPLTVSPSLSKSRRSRSMIVGARKAYPLPDPSQFENSNPTDPTHDILYPWQSFKRDAEKSQQLEKKQADMGLKRPAPPLGSRSSSIHGGEKQPSSMCLGLKQPAPPLVVKASVLQSSSVRISAEMEPVLRTPPDVKKEEMPAASSPSKVVVVYDAEMKFNIAPVDVALKSFATAEGDAIVVVAFMEHIMSPMGMKMVADLKQFSGVNESILQKTVLLKKMAIESALRETSRSQVCEVKKIQLDVKVLPGSNSKSLVAKEIIGHQATCAIFDKNAMRNRKYYEENLSCRILKLRSDGRTVETISTFGQGVEKTSSTTSHCSDSSSDSSLNSDSPSFWSKLKLFGSKRNSGSLRLSFGGHGSVLGSSRTSSNLGSPGEDEPVIAEVLEQSFSFDSPKPNPAAAYVYAAAGLEEFG